MDVIAWDSRLAAYLTQVFLHSLIIALTIEILISLWQVKKPSSRIRFRYLVIILPVVFPAAFTFIDPARSGEFFRNNMAVFDSSRWLTLHIVPGFPLWNLALVIMGICTVAFIARKLRRYIFRGADIRKRASKVSRGEYPRFDAALDGAMKGF